MNRFPLDSQRLHALGRATARVEALWTTDAERAAAATASREWSTRKATEAAARLEADRVRVAAYLAKNGIV